MAMNLFEHNKTAYEAAVHMLSECGKAAVIHPTGTGKSFIGFKLCEDNPNKTICWLSPSRYIYQTQLEESLKCSHEQVMTGTETISSTRLPLCTWIQYLS